MSRFSVWFGGRNFKTSTRWLTALAIAAFGFVIAIVASTGGVSSAKATPEFKSPMEKASYALGVNFARQLKTMAGEIDVEAMVQGFSDARATGGKTRLSPQEVNAAIVALRKKYQEQRAAARASAGPPATSVAGLSVFFKMDPLLASGTYGDRDRWVSPPTYTRVGDEKSCVIEARAQATGADRQRMAVSPRWAASDPNMVDVTPSEGGGAVRITVKRAGTSIIHVSSGTLSKELAVKAEVRNRVLQVEISQK